MADNNSFPILPQYQGDYLDAQRRMAIAQALQAQTFSPDQGTEGWNQMRVVPRLNPLSGVARIGQALLANKAYQGAIGAQRQLGQEQWKAIQDQFGGQPQTSYQATSQDQNGNPTYPPMADASQPQRMVSAPRPSALNPGGLPAGVAAMQYYRDPSGYIKEFVAPYYKPTDATLAAMQSNGAINPGQANVQAFAHSNTIPLGEARGNSWTQIPIVGPNGQVTWQSRYNQAIPEGSTPVFDQSTGQVTGVAPLAGAASVTQQQAAAKGFGAGQSELVSGYDTAGNPIYKTRTDVATGNTGGGPAPSSNFPGYTPPAGGGGFAPSLPVGTPDVVKDLTTRNSAVNNAASVARQNIQAYRGIQDAASKITTGVTLDKRAFLDSFKQVIPGLKDPGDPNSVATNANIIHKFVAQTAGRNGSRSDASLENSLNSIANGTMTNDAINEVSPYLVGSSMADLGNQAARNKWMNEHQNSPISLREYETKYNAAYDPDVYRYKAMTQPQKQAFQASLNDPKNAARKAAFLRSAQALQDLGAMPDMGQ